ncbi:Os07g0191250, partial [Oryza sativa Japonica Group]
MRAAAALPALFSSMKLIVELMMSSVMMPTKSCQSGGFPPPLARAMAMIAAASMTQDSGFHMNPKNFKNLLSFFSSSLLGPKRLRRCSALAEVRPSRLHRRCSNTSSNGMFS